MTQQFFATEFEIIKSRNVLVKVAEQLELPNKWGYDKETIFMILKGIVDTQNRRGTDLIDIKVRHTNKEDARDITAEVAKAYKNYRTEIEGRDSERGLQELRKAVRDQEDKVEERRKLLTTIVRTKGIIPTGADSLYQNSGPDDGGAGEAKRSLNKIEEDKIQLESQIKSLLNYTSEQLLVYAAGLNLPENIIKTLYPQYLEQRRRLDQLKTQGLGERHPTIQAETQNLANMRKQLEEGVTSLRETLMAQLDMATERYAKMKLNADQRMTPRSTNRWTRWTTSTPSGSSRQPRRC